MPERTIHCSICGARIRGYDFPERMAKLRRHYRAKHPRMFRAGIKRGVRTRAKARG